MSAGALNNGGGETFCFPAFWDEPSERDREVLLAQNAGRRFVLSVVRAVAKRCGHGYPQVVVCYPFTDGAPFPTTFWLTCPYLDRKCGQLESEQQISRLEDELAGNIGAVRAWHERYIKLRMSLIDPEEAEESGIRNQAFLKMLGENGVGGINYRENPCAAKCLHLQTATWLGMGRHPAAHWLEEKIGGIECADAYCGKFRK